MFGWVHFHALGKCWFWACKVSATVLIAGQHGWERFSVSFVQLSRCVNRFEQIVELVEHTVWLLSHWFGMGIMDLADEFSNSQSHMLYLGMCNYSTPAHRLSCLPIPGIKYGPNQISPLNQPCHWLPGFCNHGLSSPFFLSSGSLTSPAAPYSVLPIAVTSRQAIRPPESVT